MREAINDWTGKILGWVETDGAGNKELRNFQGQLLGTYKKNFNITCDFYGRTVAKGDCLMMLLK